MLQFLIFNKKAIHIIILASDRKRYELNAQQRSDSKILLFPQRMDKIKNRCR